MEKISEIIKKVQKSIVSVKTNTMQGTGFIIDAKGLIISNHHVLGKNYECTIALNNGKEMTGKIIIAYPYIDIAFIYVKTRARLSPIKLETGKKFNVGDTVIAYGNPLGLEDTVTKGIISALDRNIDGINYIQTDVSINPGNSGGPLINTKGKVVGINTLKMADASGIGFAIPLYSIKDKINYMLENFQQFNERLYCNTCGASSSIRRKYCKNCGILLVKPEESKKKDIVICPACNYENIPSAKYCINCGHKIKGE